MPLAPEQRDVLSVLSIIRPRAVTCGKVRIGGDNDGGYVMANDFAGTGICYSIGVGPQVIWDEAMAAKGMDVFQYDHTVDGLPAEPNPHFRFNKIGLGTTNDGDLRTLEQMLEDNGHSTEQGMILKADIEGCEWDVFDQMSSTLLGRFDQIVLEYHGLEFLEHETFRRRAERVFRTIDETHVPIHVHGNNYVGFAPIFGISVPYVIEISYARRDRFTFKPSTEIFPTHLDQPCNPNLPDLYLGRFDYGEHNAQA